MALTFDDAIAAVQAELDSALGADTVVIDARRTKQSATKSNRRISAVWVGGTLSQETVVGGVENEAGTTRTTPLYANNADVYVLISDKTFEGAETLWRAFLKAAKVGLQNASVPRSYEWTSQSDDRAGYTTADHQVLQRFEWRLVVNDEPLTLTTVNTITTTCEVSS